MRSWTLCISYTAADRVYVDLVGLDEASTRATLLDGIARAIRRPGPPARLIRAVLAPRGQRPTALVPLGPELALTDPAEQAAKPHEPCDLLDAPFEGWGDGQHSAARRRGSGP
jgi:hypothetical protein